MRASVSTLRPRTGGRNVTLDLLVSFFTCNNACLPCSQMAHLRALSLPEDCGITCNSCGRLSINSGRSVVIV